MDSSGRVGWSVHPHTAMVYSVMINGKPANSEARVQVFSLVILRAQPKGSGGRLALHGRAWPPVAGHQLVVQRQTEGGRWLPITTARLAASGRFSVQLPILGATNHRWQVWDPSASPGLTGGYSKVVGPWRLPRAGGVPLMLQAGR